eukprot:TRINITY_DN13392_c0_g1_i6.p1 TRINITY_DN13392_c0_g1~~TRINITY_DN13392_c0_g1_i6.p1  ORF type:complete len:355 (+),score=78.19 TRINITY_DN13392_c0_g1_i6:55-1119(+)
MDNLKRKDQERDPQDFRGGTDEEDEQLKKKARLEKLKAWRSNQSKDESSHHNNNVRDKKQFRWTAQDDMGDDGKDKKDIPAEIAYKRAFAGVKEQEMRSQIAAQEKDDYDPLDAFMEQEIAPEIEACKEEEEKRVASEMKKKVSDQSQNSKKIPKYLQEEDSDEEADCEIEIPMNKVKLLIGPNGTKIQEIQKKARCRIQVKKTEADLNKAFGSGMINYIPEHRLAGKEAASRMSIVQIFGSGRAIQLAQRLINEAIENKDQKQKNRQREYEKKRDEKRRNRQLFYLRHTRDYEILGVIVGASKEQVKRAYKDLAKKWHPDKHQNNKDEAKQRFQQIQMAFDSLMKMVVMMVVK